MKAIEEAVRSDAPATRVVVVEDDQASADVLQRRLQANGMVVSVALPGASASRAPVITAPLSAVVAAQRPEGHAQALVAFVVEQERGLPIARERRVVAGQLVGNEVAIESGLFPGELLVVQGATLLNDGQRVQLVP